MNKPALSIAELVELSGLGRTFIYNEIRAGRLRVRKAGTRTLITKEDADAWLSALLVVEPQKEAA